MVSDFAAERHIKSFFLNKQTVTQGVVGALTGSKIPTKRNSSRPIFDNYCCPIQTKFLLVSHKFQKWGDSTLKIGSGKDNIVLWIKLLSLIYDSDLKGKKPPNKLKINK